MTQDYTNKVLFEYILIGILIKKLKMSAHIAMRTR